MNVAQMLAMNTLDLGGIDLALNLHVRSKSAGQGECRSSNWKWHLDEVFVKINGERHYLWRAVDHEGDVSSKLRHQKERQESRFEVHEESYAALWITQRDRYR